MITSSIEARTATPTSSGFHTEALNPDNFKNINDSGLASQITSWMGNAAGGAGTSASKVTLDFTGAYCNTPISTRSTRKFKVRVHLLTDMTTVPGGAGASCIAGVRYSINNGGAYTTLIEINNTTAGSVSNNGGPTDYEVEISEDDFNKLRIEAYTNANSGTGGATSNTPFARVLAYAGYFEDFESSVNLLLVRPNSITQTFSNQYEPADSLNNNPTYTNDALNSTYSDNKVGSKRVGTTFDVTYTGVDTLEALFPNVPLGGGVVKASLVFLWSTDLDIETNGQAVCRSVCYWQANSTSVDTTNSDPRASEDTGNRVGIYHQGKALTFFSVDITTDFRETNQVKAKMYQEAINKIGLGSANRCTAYAKVYEIWMEVRVPATSGAMGGWEPV